MNTRPLSDLNRNGCAWCGGGATCASHAVAALDDQAQKKHRVGAGWGYDQPHQWHMVCRALRCKTQKKQRPLLVTGALAAKRTISRNGRCVGINCRGICDPLQSKWREFPCQTTPLPIPTSMHAVCVGACLLGADFLANSAGNREHSRFRYAWAVGNRPEWERGESEPRAKTGLAAGGDATMNLLTACMHLVTRAGKRPTTDRR